MFHENCLQEYLKSEIKSRHFPIKCPSGCEAEVGQMDMEAVLDKALVEKFYDFSLQNYVDTHADEISCCPTADCAYAFARDENDESQFKCPICKKQ